MYNPSEIPVGLYPFRFPKLVTLKLFCHKLGVAVARTVFTAFPTGIFQIKSWDPTIFIQTPVEWYKF